MLSAIFQPIPLRTRTDEVNEINRAQEKGRIASLLPMRRERMAASPFSFFRGSAGLMAQDLRQVSHSGHQVQLCGDAHLMNFGFYASPERTLLFDVNDFDETAVGPFEWDLKRLAISCALAARELGFTEDAQIEFVKALARQYRKSMVSFCGINRLDAWYSRVDVFEFIRRLDGSHFAKYLEILAKKALKNDASRLVKRICIELDGELQFNRTLSSLRQCTEGLDWIPSIADGYLATLRPELRHLLSSFCERDSVLKIVGVGSVGRRCCLVLLQGPRSRDVIILQVKEAVPSVLTASDSVPEMSVHQGKRVVEGQRLMQSASDQFLGWGLLRDGSHCYWRQFRDWKGSVELQKLDACCLVTYAELCAHALAKAHARSGDCGAIADAIVSTRRFSGLLASYALSGACQVELDFGAFLYADI
jgi:uncharacterized protein (DUF2252 family)